MAIELTFVIMDEVAAFSDVDTPRPVSANPYYWRNPETWEPGDPIYSRWRDETFANPIFEYLEDHRDGECVMCDPCPVPDCDTDHHVGMRWSYARPITDVDRTWPEMPQLMEFYGAVVDEPS